jgi:hypothetical protein
MKRKRPRAVIFSTLVEAQTCPACGAPIEGVTGVEIDPTSPRVRPEAGAFVICNECTTINVFGEDLRIRLATPAELREADPFVLEMREKYRRDHGVRRPRWQ